MRNACIHVNMMPRQGEEECAWADLLMGVVCVAVRSFGNGSEEEDDSLMEDEDIPNETEEQKAIRLAERKATQERYQRQRQLRLFREEEQRRKEERNERSERVSMMMEDKRSSLVEDYAVECAAWSKQAVQMRLRGLEMREGAWAEGVHIWRGGEWWGKGEGEGGLIDGCVVLW